MQFALQMQRRAPSVTHKNFAELAEPSRRRLEELQSTNGHSLGRRVRVARDVVRFLENSSPDRIRRVLRVLLRMLLGVEVDQVVLRRLRERLAGLAPVQLRVEHDVVQLFFPERGFWGKNCV